MPSESNWTPEEHLAFIAGLPHETNDSWPWTKISRAQMYELAAPVWRTDARGAVAPWSFGFACAGTVASLVGVAGMGRKALVERDGFFRLMLTAISLDLIYNFCLALFIGGTPGWLTAGTRSPEIMIALLAAAGVANWAALASDLCSLLLLVERLLAIKRPHLFVDMTAGKKLLLKFCTIAAVGLLSLVRTHILFSTEVTRYYDSTINRTVGDYAMSAIAGHPALVALSTVSDIVLPFVMLGCMLVLSPMLMWTVVRRSQIRKTLRAEASAERERQRNADERQRRAGMFGLAVGLNFLFLLNQFAFCIMSSVQIVLNYTYLSFDDTEARVAHWVYVHECSDTIVAGTTLVEIISHALKCPVYFTMNSAFRDELFKLIRKSKLVFFTSRCSNGSSNRIGSSAATASVIRPM